MNPSYDDIAVYAELANRSELTARIYAAPLEPGWYDQAKLGVHRSFGSPWLRIGAVKGYADGSLGSTTAYFFQPYTDAPETARAALRRDAADSTRCAQADGRGSRGAAAVHARASATRASPRSWISSATSSAPTASATAAFRIEHAQHIAPKDFDRFAAMKVIASVQPYHAIDDGRWAERRIGPDRIKTTYAFRTLIDKGVRLALGTDWTVAPLNPMLTLYAATTRATLDGKNPGGLGSGAEDLDRGGGEGVYERIGVCRVSGSREGHDCPREDRGFSVILSDDVFSIPAARLKDVQVLTTVAGGKVVHQRRP